MSLENLSGAWVPHHTRDQIVDDVNYWARLDRRSFSPSKKGAGFVKPLSAYEHWHGDVSYINISGTFYYLTSMALLRPAVLWFLILPYDSDHPAGTGRQKPITDDAFTERELLRRLAVPVL